MNSITAKIMFSYKSGNYQKLFDDISYDKSVCIELLTGNTYVYSSDAFNRGCIAYNSSESLSYKKAFIKSNQTRQTYEFINPKFHNKTLMSALKLEDGVYVFVNTSLDPIDSTISILKNQFLYVSIVVLLLSFLIGYFISKRLSKPIAEGQYDVVFTTEDDIDELNKLADTLNYTRDELMKTEELRRDLMANVGHDLKTPLTMIKAYAEMVRDFPQQEQEKREENLNVIIEETDRLNLLVNDIVTLSLIQSGALELKTESFDFASLIRTIIKRYRILKETEDYKFEFSYQGSLWVKADKKQMEQVIYNLLNNAINYTGTDKTITIQIIEMKEQARIAIHDSGKGIKKEDLPWIWDRYYKSSKKHKRNTIGTGLGLSIVKNIFQQHNLNYGVSSKKGQGTTFYFDIPKTTTYKDNFHEKDG